ncbi:lactoylglutathione lyase [Achlya hypogyna]|uniref:Lactoylglutathione lyase n=1 Tax=Achlya hypogyna TaxID=1202772 RepID=A0A1V9ZLH5_ACHHY|nr:lactoylglutathione lyase [Achlya hypogyna]
MASPRLASALKNVIFNQTMLRVKDPKKSVAFYEKHFGMTLAHAAHFSDFSLYFLVSLPTTTLPESKKTIDYVWSGEYGCTLELTHNHGTEADPAFKYHIGNTAPLGAFGYVGFKVPAGHLGAARASLEADGHTASTTNAAVVTADPDGYPVRVEERTAAATNANPSWHRSMIRVRNGKASADFYQTICGLHLYGTKRNTEDASTSYFLGSVPQTTDADWLENQLGTVLELREFDETPAEGYVNGNTEPYRGFGHLALIVDDVYETCAAMEELGVAFQKKPDDGRMKGLAFIKDIDNYWIEIIRRQPLA